MKIEVTNLRKNTIEGKLLGLTDIILNDSILIRDIKIIDYNGSKFTAFPAKKVNDKYYDVIHPTVAELRDKINSAIFSTYYGWSYTIESKEDFYITDMKFIKSTNPNSDVEAAATIVLNNQLCIHDILIVKRSETTDYTMSLPVLVVGDKSKEVLKILDQQLEERIMKEIWERYKQEK